MPTRSIVSLLAVTAALFLTTNIAHAQRGGHIGGGAMSGGMRGGGFHAGGGASSGGGFHAGGGASSGGGFHAGGGASSGGGWHGGSGWRGGSGWHGGGWHGHGGWGSDVIIGVGPYWGPYWGWGWDYPYYYPPYAYYPPGYYGEGPPYPESQSDYVERSDDDDADSGRASRSYWYYCPSSHGYYPDVRKCSKDWIKVPSRSAERDD